MLIDARALPNDHTLRADVCVVGAGAAGLTIAQALARADLRTVVLESGDTHARRDTQRLYQGTIIGHAYYALDTCRFRTLGGTTSVWGGWCRPLDAVDFEPFESTRCSGWPFAKSELDPFYARAEAICRLAPSDGDDRAWNIGGAPPLIRRDCALFETVTFQVQPTRFGDVYRAPLQRSRNVDLLLNASVVDLAYHARGGTVTSLRCATLRGNSITVKADTVVLAAGGVENARILLTSNGPRGHAVGNEHDLVGRYFFDHLHVTLGVTRAAGDSGQYYQLHRRDGVAVRRGLVPTDSARRESRTRGFAVTLHNARDPSDVVGPGQRFAAYVSLQTLAAGVRNREWPEHGLHHLWNAGIRLPDVCRHVYRRFVKPPATTLLIGCRAEQVPTPESRVTLDRSRDRLGVPRVRLDWRVSSEDLTGLTRAQALIADALADDSVRLFHFGEDARRAHPVWGGAHHMGTTRMARDPRHGVVDEHGRVHSARNLYVAGSSVFPTGGWAPPTLTIVALALRLADHLATDTSQRYATA